MNLLNNQKDCNKTIELILSAISHDLITPITIIRTNIEFLEREIELTEIQKKRTDVVFNKVNQIQEMFDTLNLYISLQYKRYNINKILVDGEEFFEMLVSGYDDLCNNKNIELISNIKVSGVYEVDVKLLIAVIDNLIDNSVRYTPPSKYLWLTVSIANEGIPDYVFDEYKVKIPSQKNGVYIIVQNEGEKLIEDEELNVFEPFYQVEKNRNKNDGQGFGLGLSICEIIIKKHNGTIQFYTGSSKGSTMIVWLPEHLQGDI